MGEGGTSSRSLCVQMRVCARLRVRARVRLSVYACVRACALRVYDFSLRARDSRGGLLAEKPGIFIGSPSPRFGLESRIWVQTLFSEDVYQNIQKKNAS